MKCSKSRWIGKKYFENILPFWRPLKRTEWNERMTKRMNTVADIP